MYDRYQIQEGGQLPFCKKKSNNRRHSIIFKHPTSRNLKLYNMKFSLFIDKLQRLSLVMLLTVNWIKLSYRYLLEMKNSNLCQRITNAQIPADLWKSWIEITNNQIKFIFIDKRLGPKSYRFGFLENFSHKHGSIQTTSCLKLV